MIGFCASCAALLAGFSASRLHWYDKPLHCSSAPWYQHLPPGRAAAADRQRGLAAPGGKRTVAHSQATISRQRAAASLCRERPAQCSQARLGYNLKSSASVPTRPRGHLNDDLSAASACLIGSNSLIDSPRRSRFRRRINTDTRACPRGLSAQPGSPSRMTISTSRSGNRRPAIAGDHCSLCELVGKCSVFRRPPLPSMATSRHGSDAAASAQYSSRCGSAETDIDTARGVFTIRELARANDRHHAPRQIPGCRFPVEARALSATVSQLRAGATQTAAVGDHGVQRPWPHFGDNSGGGEQHQMRN